MIERVFSLSEISIVPCTGVYLKAFHRRFFTIISKLDLCIFQCTFSWIFLFIIIFFSWLFVSIFSIISFIILEQFSSFSSRFHISSSLVMKFRCSISSFSSFAVFLIFCSHFSYSFDFIE